RCLRGGIRQGARLGAEMVEIRPEHHRRPRYPRLEGVVPAVPAEASADDGTPRDRIEALQFADGVEKQKLPAFVARSKRTPRETPSLALRFYGEPMSRRRMARRDDDPHIARDKTRDRPCEGGYLIAVQAAEHHDRLVRRNTDFIPQRGAVEMRHRLTGIFQVAGDDAFVRVGSQFEESFPF